MLNETDLLTFNHAVALAKSGRKSMANEMIEELLRTNLTDVNLYLWYAYTCEDFTKAYNAVQLAHRYEPINPSVLQAESWLKNQFPDRYGSRTATVTTTTTVVSSGAIASRFKLNKLSRKMQAKVNAVLKPDEEVKWVGKPAFLPSFINIFDITFATIGFGGFIIGIVLLLFGLDGGQTYDYETKRLFVRWGLNIGGIGAFFIVCFLATIIVRLSTVYILTDRRAIIAKDMLGFICLLDAYTRVDVKLYNTFIRQKWGGYGDLIFATKATKYSNRDPSRAYAYRRRSFFTRGWGLSNGDEMNNMIGSDGDIGIAEIGFTAIPNVEQVYKLFTEVFDTTAILET